MTRKINKYKNLFDQYDRLDKKQENLYEGKLLLPKEKRKDWEELQIKKIAILEEMEKSL